MPEALFVSYAQHGEDVVLWRALRDIPNGRYVEVGANHPTDLSITRAFYDRGWSGVTIDPVASFAALHRRARPRDTFVQAAVTNEDVENVVLNEFPETGLSTLDAEITERHDAAGHPHHATTVRARRLDAILDDAGLAGKEIHFITVDTEGSERAVLQSLDLTHWRPWILVVESTVPLGTAQTHDSWEPALLAAGYTFCMFDGLSRYYVADEHKAHLGPRLSYPACPLDLYARQDTLAAKRTIDELTEARDTATDELIRWRTEAIARWSHVLSSSSSVEVEGLRRQVAELSHDLVATRATLSWRITAPLRAGRRLFGRGA
ncbi:FkbM family methyltransferase [Actinotalea sp. K2]|uniref:FkbM family methyltransferase n=1 Tax=Actinotalea sp. K2 TaxID=2939438 RepID=UPI0020177BF9|nr:FkbM family methyltransferase [Actinotalea sp. K2]MCL3862719.1 FkbM family methyltransferase [Actinotalea sp. K2]